MVAMSDKERIEKERKSSRQALIELQDAILHAIPDHDQRVIVLNKLKDLLQAYLDAAGENVKP